MVISQAQEKLIFKEQIMVVNLQVTIYFMLNIFTENEKAARKPTSYENFKIVVFQFLFV